MKPRLWLSLCLILNLLECCSSQLKFKPKFSSIPLKDPKRIPASSFGDQASKFRRVFFQRQKPTLLKTNSEKHNEDHRDVEGTTTTPADVSTKATTASVASAASSNANDKATATELREPVEALNVELASSRTEVKDEVISLRRKLFQRPRFSVLSSISGESKPLRPQTAFVSTLRSTTTTLKPTTASPVFLSTTRGTFNRSEESSTVKTLPVKPEVILGESYEETISTAVKMMEDVFLDTLQHTEDKASDRPHVSRNVKLVPFNRKSLLGKLRPLVVDILSSSEASQLTLDERVEKLRNVLMKESPETVRSNFESSSFYFHARNLFLKIQNSSEKIIKSTVFNAGENPSEGEAERGDVKENNLRLSFRNLRNWNLTPETTTSPYSAIDVTDVRGRLHFPKVVQGGILSTRTSVAKTTTMTTTEMIKVRRVVFSSLSYPSLPGRGWGLA